MKSEFKFLPRGLSGLLDYISPLAFDVVDWQSALKKTPKITSEIILKTYRNEFVAGSQHKIPARINLRASLDKNIAKDRTKTKLETTKMMGRDEGQLLLNLYFFQIFKSRRIFLDFRKERFLYSDEGTLNWSPSGLWAEFSEQTLQGFQELYIGFYRSDEMKLESGLSRLGFFSDNLPAEKKVELKGLLEVHFGPGKTELVKFKVSNFISSFDSIFMFLKSNKIKLSEDFMFFGIYILTLYMHLESLDEEFDVAEAFNTVFV